MSKSLLAWVAVLAAGVLMVGCAAEAETEEDEEAAIETTTEVAADKDGHDYLITPDEKTELVAAEGEQLTKLTVSNVTCSGCTMTIHNELMALDGVKGCQFDEIDAANGMAYASVVFDPEATDIDSIIATIAAIEDEEYAAVEEARA